MDRHNAAEQAIASLIAKTEAIIARKNIQLTAKAQEIGTLYKVKNTKCYSESGRFCG